jgi:hypothetical protein
LFCSFPFSPLHARFHDTQGIAHFTNCAKHIIFSRKKQPRVKKGRGRGSIAAAVVYAAVAPEGGENAFRRNGETSSNNFSHNSSGSIDNCCKALYNESGACRQDPEL